MIQRLPGGRARDGGPGGSGALGRPRSKLRGGYLLPATPFCSLPFWRGSILDSPLLRDPKPPHERNTCAHTLKSAPWGWGVGAEQSGTPGPAISDTLRDYRHRRRGRARERDGALGLTRTTSVQKTRFVNVHKHVQVAGNANGADTSTPLRLTANSTSDVPDDSHAA